MTEVTIEIIEAKRMDFLRWQGEGAGRYKGYRDLWNRVRRAFLKRLNN